MKKLWEVIFDERVIIGTTGVMCLIDTFKALECLIDLNMSCFLGYTLMAGLWGAVAYVHYMKEFQNDQA